MKEEPSEKEYGSSETSLNETNKEKTTVVDVEKMSDDQNISDIVSFTQFQGEVKEKKSNKSTLSKEK